MKSRDWDRAEALFQKLAELDTDGCRAGLAAARREDADLATEVESLLAEHRGEGVLDRLSSRLSSIGAGLAALPATGLDDLTDRTVGQYEIIELAGHGGMGDVYRARDTRLGRDVALKFLPRWLGRDPAARDRLVLEARVVSSLDHPNVCTLFEIGESADGRPFLVMPFYEGETVKSRLERGPLAPHLAVDIAVQAARGLAAAHERGIVHRDIKPGNLLVTPEGRVKLLDFGVAKLADLSLTHTGQTPGTTAYMSPEQAGGRDVDARTDLWSLGVVLYEMLTGRRPFGGDRPAAVLRAIEQDEPPLVSELRPGVEPAIEVALEWLLARAPDDRFGSARAFIEYFERPETRVAAPPRARGLLPDGERRQATVVVSLLAGYEELIEEQGPRRARSVAERVSGTLAEIVEHNGGVVNRLGADEGVFLFGVAAVHEDDHLRAIRTALEANEAVRALYADDGPRHASGNDPASPLRLRTGIDTDRVLARPIRDGAGRFEVIGSASRRAARLAASASPGDIIVSPACRELIEPYFSLEPRPTLPASGAEAALVPWAVHGRSDTETRFEAAVRFGLTPFTGRESELARLREHFEAAVAGAGRVVLVSGEAGVGKSRLLHEFRHLVERRPVDQWMGRCSSLAGRAAYLPFIEIVRNVLATEGDFASAETWSRLEARLGEIDPDLVELLPLYGHLLSIDAEEETRLPRHFRGGQLQAAIEGAIAELLGRAAGQRPVVVFLEDWHWADGPSAGVLRRLRETVPDHALLIVVTARTEARGSEADGFARIALEPLADDATRSMLAAMLEVDDAPRPLARLLRDRTGGNPFFLEETCRALVESGDLQVKDGRVTLHDPLDARRFPATVQAVIRTRLDRLRRDPKEVLRLASVVGTEFSGELLQRTFPAPERLPEALDALTAAGLVAESTTGPALVYRFRHALVQEVAYASVLEHERRELHRRVGDALVDLSGGAVDEHADRLTHHFGRAGDWDRAVEYGIRWARRAHEFSQFTEALRILDQVDGWLEKVTDDSARTSHRIVMLQRAEELCEILGERDRQQMIIDELIVLLDPDADAGSLAEVYLRQGDLRILLNEPEAAEDALQRSLRMHRKAGDAAGQRKALRSLGLLRCRQQRLAEAIEFNERALAIDRKLGDAAATLGDLANMGHLLMSDGQLEAARSLLEEALRSADVIPSRDGAPAEDPLWEHRAVVLHNLGRVYSRLGETEAATTCLRRAIRANAAHHCLIGMAYHTTTLAGVEVEGGRVTAGLASYRKALERYQRVRFAPGVARAHLSIGEILLGLGEHAEARDHLERALEGFERLQDAAAAATARTRIARLLNTMGIAEWERGQFEAALTRFEEALAWAERAGDAEAAGQLENSVGVTLGALGRPAEARATLERALARHERTDDSAQAGYALAALADLALEQGRAAPAREYYAASLAIRRQRGDRLGEGWMLCGWARASAACGDSEQARERLDRAAEIAAELEHPELVEACEALSRSPGFTGGD